MAIEGSTTLKSYFEKGDQPTSAQFSSLIDSAILIPVSGASAKVGFVEIESSASATAHALGTFNRGFLLDVANTAAARDFLAITSASGGGGGSVGQAVLNANTTASVVSIVQGDMAATSAQVSARTATNVFVSPGFLGAHPGIGSVMLNFNGSGATLSSRRSMGVASAGTVEAGRYVAKFSQQMPDETYVAMVVAKRRSGAAESISTELFEQSVSGVGIGVNAVTTVQATAAHIVNLVVF